MVWLAHPHYYVPSETEIEPDLRLILDYWVAYGQTQSRSAFCLFVFFFFRFFFFSVSVKVLPVTPLVSGVFVHRAFCAYFLRIERVVELRRFLWWTQ